MASKSGWSGARVLVTGAGGFIGSHLAEELARRGARVRALVRYNSRSDWGFLEGLSPELAKRIEVVSGDVTDPYCVGRLVKDQEAVFHLAALIGIPYSYEAPASYVATNVSGTLNVLEACRAHRVRRLVHTSTSEVYGTARYVPIDEAHPLQGQSPYSASKIGADHLAESFHRSFGLPVSICRPFNTFGPRQSARAVLAAIVSQLLGGATSLRLGSLAPVRDFTYVSDTVAGFLAIASSPRAVGEAINLGVGSGVTIGRAVELIQGLTGRRACVARDAARVRPSKSEVLRLISDNRKARRLTGWRPVVPFEEGLRRLIGYVRANPGRYKPSLYAV